MAVFMLKTLKLSKMLKSSQDDFNVLDNFNVSSIKKANLSLLNVKCAARISTPRGPLDIRGWGCARGISKTIAIKL